MSYQFHAFRASSASQSKASGFVIHRVRLVDYPNRVFSAWLSESGELLDAESRDARSGCKCLNVKRGGVQWETLAARVAQIWRFESANAGVDNDKRERV